MHEHISQTADCHRTNQRRVNASCASDRIVRNFESPVPSNICQDTLGNEVTRQQKENQNCMASGGARYNCEGTGGPYHPPKQNLTNVSNEDNESRNASGNVQPHVCVLWLQYSLMFAQRCPQIVARHHT